MAMKLKIKSESDLDRQYQLVQERLSSKTVAELIFSTSMSVAEVKKVQIIAVGNLFNAMRPGFQFSFSKRHIRFIEFDQNRYDVQIVLDNGMLVGVKI